MAGRAKDQYQKSGLRFEDILPGNYDGAAHLKDMDTDGVDVSIVYPANLISHAKTPRRKALRPSTPNIFLASLQVFS